MTTRVLVVDDEEAIVEFVRDSLADAGIETVDAADGTAALAAVRAHRPDLVILDVALPGVDGLEVCRRLRRDAESAHLPVIMLTARGAEVDRVVGLEVGADDYVVKPFSGRELVARVRALLRRAQSPPMPVLRAGGLVIDEARREVTVDGAHVDLTASEFLILAALVRANGRVLSRDQLFAAASGTVPAGSIQSRTVDVHVSHLRDKLGAEGRRIVTVKGAGYRIDGGA